jgi:UDP-N-acetylglucosamine--N-acetylmuramyl-(pentapeptide) pyrophosphoryl-undecaprenol N-acetylglucosamine transferase
LKYLDQNIYNLKIINTPKINNIFFLPFNIIKILFLTFKSFFLLKDMKIQKVFSTGGYMSLPIILAAKILKLEIYLLEPNQVLGRANKYFLNSCKKIFCYSEKIKNFPDKFKNKISMINPLVKEQMYDLELSDSIDKKFTLLIVGGSQGAEIFDKTLKDIIVNLSTKAQIKVIHQTSKKNVTYLTEFYTNNNVENKIFNFDKNFFNIIQQADLCITRAGASTLAELSIMNTPFIAVPLPSSKDNHQFENASYYERNDCCWIIEQSYLETNIEEVLKDILNNKTNYLRKKENLKKLNYQNTWNNVNQKILNIINEN